MAKRVHMDPKLDPTPAAAMVHVGGRDVRAEQVSQQKTLDTREELLRQCAQIDAKINAEAEKARKLAEAAMTAELRAAHQAEMRKPLTRDESVELVELEEQAHMPGNRPPENMHRLADLRIRSRVSVRV